MRRRTQSGFSLIEFLLVVVLISILAAIIVPRFEYGHITQQEVYAVAHTIAKDLRKTRRYAIGQGDYGNQGMTTHTTVPAYKSYGLKILSSTSWEIWEFNGAPPSRSLVTQTLRNDEVLVSSAANDFVFDNWGTPTTPGAGGVIEVKDFKDRYQWNVSVIKNTGRVTLVRVK
jgi:prepilin-type N-terminal cleavage/methylation domain-containing protein